MRARRQTRLRCAVVQPDRLRLHSCYCVCHDAYTGGNDDLPAARYAASTRTLQISRALASAPHDGVIRAASFDQENHLTSAAYKSAAARLAFSRGGRRVQADESENLALTTSENDSGACSSPPASVRSPVAVKPAAAVLGVQFWRDSRGRPKHTVGWGVGIADDGTASPIASPTGAVLAVGESSAMLSSPCCAPAGLPAGACPSCFCLFPPFQAVELRAALDRARASAATSRLAKPLRGTDTLLPEGSALAATTTSPGASRWASARRVMAVERWGYFSAANPAVPSYLQELLSNQNGSSQRPRRGTGSTGITDDAENHQDAPLQELAGSRLTRLAGSARTSIRDLLGYGPASGPPFSLVANGHSLEGRGVSLPALPVSSGRHRSEGFGLGSDSRELGGSAVQRAHTIDIPAPRTGGSDRPVQARLSKRGVSQTSSGMPLPSAVIIGAGLHGLSVVAVAVAKRYAASLREKQQQRDAERATSTGGYSESSGTSREAATH